jgi:hypothetical protein
MRRLSYFDENQRVSPIFSTKKSVAVTFIASRATARSRGGWSSD